MMTVLFLPGQGELRDIRTSRDLLRLFCHDILADLKQFDLNAKAIRMLSTKDQQPIVDMSAHVK